MINFSLPTLLMLLLSQYFGNPGTFNGMYEGALLTKAFYLGRVMASCLNKNITSPNRPQHQTVV